MKNIFGKITGLVVSIFLATSAFAWTPTVEVVRDSNNVLLRVSGWTTPSEFGEIDWNTYNVKIMIANQALDITGGVAALFLSAHPAVTATIGNSFDLSIALNPYFQIDPMLYPVRLKVCKQAAYGGECADTAENLVKRDPADFTANATCYPDPTCATRSGGFSSYPRADSTESFGSGDRYVATSLILDKATVITGVRAVVTNSSPLGVPNDYGNATNNILINVHSSATNYSMTPGAGDVVNRATGTVAASLFGLQVPGVWQTSVLQVTLSQPLTLQAGSYVFSVFACSNPFNPNCFNNGTDPMSIMMSSVQLGSDMSVDASFPGTITLLSSVGGGFSQRNTAAVDILGF